MKAFLLYALLLSLVCVHLAHSLPLTSERPMYRSDLFEGDILKGAKGIAQISTPMNKWPNGVVPYAFSSIYSKSELEIISLAMRHIEDSTQVNGKDCIKFLPRTLEASYLNIRKGDGCTSYVGKIYSDKPQEVSLTGNCINKGIIAHELMHALGFWHEQSRPDRDQYVHVAYENITTGLEHAFEKYDTDETDDLGLPYDYDSLMHYEWNAFSKNQLATIVPLKPGVQLLSAQSKLLSPIDIQEIIKYYACV